MSDASDRLLLGMLMGPLGGPIDGRPCPTIARGRRCMLREGHRIAHILGPDELPCGQGGYLVTIRSESGAIVFSDDPMATEAP